MRAKERHLLVKTVLTEASIESSSDFIVTLYELCKIIDKDMVRKIDPIYHWEYKNWHNDWQKNVNFISNRMVDLSSSDYDEIYGAYTDILTYFLENRVVTKIYDLSTEDDIGWKIFKELSEKRVETKRMCNIMLMKENHEIQQ